MPETEIFFLDRNYQPTTDRVTGTPNVNATVLIDGMEVLSAQPAVIDTGAEFCVINADELSQLLSVFPFKAADKSKIPYPQLSSAKEDVYEGTIAIHGMAEFVQTYFTVKDYRPRILIGRHVLEHYTMIYDPLGGVFSLAKP